MLNVKKTLTKILTGVKKTEQRTLLWTNSNPSSDFASQTFTIASGYDLVEVQTTGGICCKSSGDEFNFCRYEWGNGGAQLYARSMTYNKSTGEFWADNGIVAGLANMTNFAIDNSVMKPYKIYGIKLGGGN